MKRLHNISESVRAQIIADYKRRENGQYVFTLREIAQMHEISLSSVNNVAHMAGCQCRPQGGKKSYTPSARDMKVLRDMTIPGITLDEVGKMNPRAVYDPELGRTVLKALTKQRVCQIAATWRKRGLPVLHGKGFKKGQRIEWDGQFFTVLRYDNARRGAVKTEKGEIWDPFFWVYKGQRAKAAEETTA
jgi:hypothetical protein